MLKRRLALGGLGIIAAAGLACGADTTPPAEPAIVRAAYWGDEKAVAAALAAHADVNAANTDGATALLYGVQSFAIERELIEHGANPNLAAKSGMTPLMAAAAQCDSYETVKLLLAHGADVHAKIQTWEPALPAAIYGGDRRTIRLLLDHGANPGSSGKMTFSPLATAAYMGDLVTIKDLLDLGANPNDNADFAGHALNYALYSGADDCAAELIRRGSDLHLASPGGAGTPPIVFAAYHRTDPALMKMLVARGASLQAMNENGANAMTFAARTQVDSPLSAYLRSLGLKDSTAHGLPAAPTPAPLTPVELSDALLRPRLRRAVAALQLSSDAFLARGFVQHDAKCVSCHQQSLPEVAALVVAQHGVPVDFGAVGRAVAAQDAEWSGILEQVRQLRFDASPDPSLVLGYPGFASAAWHRPADGLAAAMARFLISQQQSNGAWAEHDLRPPIEDGPIVGTGFAANFVAQYAAPQQRAAAALCVDRARRFLESAQPDTFNRQVFKLLGLYFTGAPRSARTPLAQAIIARQRPDGGWEQFPGRGSDAWATGTVLVTLARAAGMPPADPVYRKGAAFLVRTQGEDGVWWVRSRTWPFQPHFDGKFPHGKDQWISAAGTSWAVIALGVYLNPPAQPARLPTVGELLTMAGKSNPWGSAPPAEAHLAVGAASAANAAMFRRDIAPLFERSCYGCHGGDKHRGGLSLATRDGLLKGGQSGDPAVVVGKSDDSQLIDFVSDKVEDLEMPPLDRRTKYPALSVAEIDKLRAWVDAGAPWDKGS